MVLHGPPVLGPPICCRSRLHRHLIAVDNLGERPEALASSSLRARPLDQSPPDEMVSAAGTWRHVERSKTVLSRQGSPCRHLGCCRPTRRWTRRSACSTKREWGCLWSWESRGAAPGDAARGLSPRRCRCCRRRRSRLGACGAVPCRPPLPVWCRRNLSQRVAGFSKKLTSEGDALADEVRCTVWGFGPVPTNRSVAAPNLAGGKSTAVRELFHLQGRCRSRLFRLAVAQLTCKPCACCLACRCPSCPRALTGSWRARPSG